MRALAAALAFGLVALALAGEARADDPPGAALARIREKKEIRWGADATGGAPYVVLDPRNPNNYLGYEVELASALAEKLGAKPSFVQGDFDKLLDLVGRGDFEIALNGIEATDEKKRVCELTRCYYVAAERLAVRAGDRKAPRTREELRARPIATLPGTLAEQILRSAGAEVRPYSGGQEGLYDDLVNGRVDGVLIDEPVAMYYGALRPEVELVPAFLGEVRYAIATKKGQTELRDALDRALDELEQEGKLRAIYERWGLWNGETAALLHDPEVPSRGAHAAWDEWRRAKASRTFFERLTGYGLYLPQFLEGAATTLRVSLLAFALAVLLGMILAISRRYGPLPIRWAAIAYIELFRGTPLLVQLYFIYFGLPELGLTLQPLTAGVLGLALNYAAAEAENYRAGLESVPAGQLEACWALGLSTFQAVRYVIVPQAVRVAIPPATNDFIALLKDSSLVSVITMTELLRVAGNLASATRDSRGMYAICALFYLLLGLPFARLARYAEQRMSSHLRRIDT